MRNRSDTPLRVLVTGANSTVAQSVIKALKASSLPTELYGCDINPYSPGLYRVHRGFLVRPFDHPDYEAEMIDLLKRERVDVLLPCVEAELQQLADRRALWEWSTGTRVLVNSRALLDITQDKYLTAEFLAEYGCAAPRSWIDTSPEGLERFIEAVGFPLIVKPRRGNASRHVHVVHDRAALAACLPTVPGPVLQEYLGSPEEEYTAGAFVDAGGVLRGVAVLRRTMANGITGLAISDVYPDVEAEVRRIVQLLRPEGSVNVQLRRHHSGRPTAFEINARFSSSVAIRAHFGFNEAEATLRSFCLGQPVPVMRCRPGVAMRYVNEVYAEAAEVRTLMAMGYHAPQARVENHF